MKHIDIGKEYRLRTKYLGYHQKISWKFEQLKLFWFCHSHEIDDLRWNEIILFSCFRFVFVLFSCCSLISFPRFVPVWVYGYNLWEGEFEENLLLIIDDVDSGPIHRDDHVVLRQSGTRKLCEEGIIHLIRVCLSVCLCLSVCVCLCLSVPGAGATPYSRFFINRFVCGGRGVGEEFLAKNRIILRPAPRTK